MEVKKLTNVIKNLNTDSEKQNNRWRVKGMVLVLYNKGNGLLGAIWETPKEKDFGGIIPMEWLDATSIIMKNILKFKTMDELIKFLESWSE